MPGVYIPSQLEDILTLAPRLVGLSSLQLPPQCANGPQNLTLGSGPGLRSSRKSRIAVNGGVNYRLLYCNSTKITTGENPNTNPVWVYSALEAPVGTLYPVTFGGQRWGVVQGGGFLLSDPVGLFVPPGGIFYERVFVSTSQSPFVATPSTVSSGGSLSAATYYYKITSVTDAGESGPSNEVSVTTTGSSSTVSLVWGDANPQGVTTRQWRIYRSTTTGTETLLDVVPGITPRYTDTGAVSPPSTTISATVSNATVSVASTAGFTQGDSITISGATGNPFVINNVVSATSMNLTVQASVTNGATVTRSTAPPTAPVFPVGGWVSGSVANEGVRTGVNVVDLTAFGFPSTETTTYYAYGVYATPTASALKPTIGIIGDSIADGTGWQGQITYRGFVAAALNDTFPFMQLTCAGETAATFSGNRFSRQRIAALAGCKYVVCNYGTNDIGNATLSQIQSYLVGIAKMIATGLGATICQTTITPKTSSTDGWYTLANQVSGGANETLRQALNTWIRTPATGVSTSGVSYAYDCILAGVPARKILVADVAAQVEVDASGNPTINGGYWKAPGTSLATASASTNGSTTSFTDSTKAWTVNQWQGKMARFSHSGVYYCGPIASNTATTLTISSTAPFTSSSSTTLAPTTGDALDIYDGATQDGTHPVNSTHLLMAQAIPVASFV